MSPIYINPGTEPLYRTRLKFAEKNIKQFISDGRLNPKPNVMRLKDMDGGGRYGFLLWIGTRCHTVTMPGLELERVRYMNFKIQNPWDFPRLYVDGSSLLWKFALLKNNDFREVDEQ